MIQPFLKWIRIQNFRSLFDLKIDFKNLTVFVGKNDSGKSNILKAINLFFNDEISPGNPLVFDRDYAKGVPEKKRKAKEIRIQAGFALPPVYKGIKDVVQTKVWRKSGLFSDNTTYDRKKIPPSRSRVRAWLTKLNYRYVPAIKDSDYFSSLLRELHGTLATKVDEKLKKHSGDFVDFIRQETRGVTEDVAEHLNLESRLQLPPDLGALFEVLDFETNDEIALSERGDGIRARHIPIVLDFISSQKKGQLRSDAIWGYEEPENNIEMGQALKYADAFMGYATDKQIVMTTHSPIFYALAKREHCNAYRVSKQGRFETEICLSTSAQSELDNEMGVAEFLAPRIEKSLTERARRQRKVATPQNALAVEGKFDRIIFEAILEKKFQSSNIIVLHHNGAAGVKGIAYSRAMNRDLSEFKTYALFDLDKTGEKEKKGLNESLGHTDKVTARCLCVDSFEHLKQIQRIIGTEVAGTISIQTESLLQPEHWRYAKNKDWLVKISDEQQEVIMKNRRNRRLDTPLSRQFEELLQLIDDQIGPDHRLLVEYKIKQEYKQKFARYAAEQIKGGTIPPDLLALVRQILNKLG